MITMNSTSFADFIATTITKKSLLLQYSETTTNYDIYACDNMFVWNYSILKDGNAEQVLFETTYKSKCNQKVGQGDFSPYAIPIFRTKRNAIDSVKTCPPNTTTAINFQLPSELHAHGGCLIIKNAELGDYVYAEVKDVDGIIPSPYRTALCESWPVVAQYIPKEFIEISNGAYTVQKIDTSPLIAKITAGLYLTISYVAVNAGTDRLVAINYYLDKKL